MAEEEEMYRCQGPPSCGYIYVPDRGDKKRKIPPGTSFDELPQDWCCPSCGLSKERFREMTRAASGTEETEG